MSRPKCLRCGAGAEWIEGKVPNEPAEGSFAAPDVLFDGNAPPTARPERKERNRMSTEHESESGGGVGSSACLAGWTDQECRQLLEELLADEKGRCCKIKLLTSDVSGPCDASVSRYAHHEQKRFSSARVALAWLEDKWALYVQGMKPANAGTQRPGTPDGPLATETRKPGSLK